MRNTCVKFTPTPTTTSGVLPRKKQRAGLLLLLVALSLGLGSTLCAPSPSWATPPVQLDTAEDWPMLGHDLARTGTTSDQVNNSSAQDMPTLWVRDFASADNPKSELINFGVQPIVVQGVVYIPTMSNRLHALNADTGETLWIFDAGEPGAMLHSPAVVGNVAYVGSTDGHLYAVNTATGQENWRFQAGRGGFGASPAVTADTVYIGGRNGSFYALRTSNGSARWTYDVGAPIMNSAAVDEARERVYFGAEDMRVYALNTANGSLVWRSDQLNGRSFRHYYPVLVGDTLFIRTNPAMQSAKALEEGDALILQAAGVSNYGGKRAVIGEDPLDIHATWTQSGWNAEINVIDQFLRDHPEYQTWYALDVNSGNQRYRVPILWSGGSGHVGEPPVARDSNHIIVYLRSYYSNYDLTSYYLFGGFGELEVSTGNLSILNLAEDPGDNGALWPYGVGVIGDEQNTPSLGGDVLYVTSHGDTVGGVNLLSRQGVRGIITRDRPWNLSPRNLPFMGQVSTAHHELPSPREGAGSVVPYGNRLYWVTMSTVGALAGDGKAATTRHWPAGAEGNATDAQDASQSTIQATQLAPPPSELESYVLNVPSYSDGGVATSDLRAELEEQVSDLITTRYAPLIFAPGKVLIRFYFQDPAEVFYSLSIALPYLSPTLQSQVKSYLEQEWQQHNPLTTSRYSLSEGQRREFHSIGSDGLADAYDHGSDRTPDRVEILYAVWAYAHYADRWDVVADNWSLIKNLVTSTINPNDPSTLLSNPETWSLGSVNRRTSALIAYTRMAQKMNDAAAYAWGLDAATRSLAARINHEETNRPAIGEWHATGSRGGKFVYRSGSHRTWIPRYRDLTPEIGAALRDYAAADLANQAQYLRVVRPTWYVAWGPQVFEGEVSTNWPQHAMDIFNAQAMMFEAPSDELRIYLDQPWSAGDLYFIQKLVYTIRSYGTLQGEPEKRVDRSIASTGDTLSYTITVPGSGKPITLTDAIPTGTAYVPGSATREPAIGTLVADEAGVTWAGTIPEGTTLLVTFAVTVSATEPLAIINQAQVNDGQNWYTPTATSIANGFEIYLPVISKGY